MKSLKLRSTKALPARFTTMNSIDFRKMQNITFTYGSSQRPALIEKLFTVFVFVLSTYAVIPLLLAINKVKIDPVRGNTVMQVLWLAVFLITFIILLLRLRQVVRIAFQDKCLWFLVGLSFLSAFWSAIPLVTLRNSAALLGTTLLGVYLASRYTRQELVKLLLWALGLIAVLSLVFSLLWPQYGIQHYSFGTAWRGVYIHKNLLGNFMVLASITSFIYAVSHRKKRLAGSLVFVISITLLLLSTSKTALAILFILLFLLAIMRILRLHYMQSKQVLILVILSVSGLAVWLAYNMDVVFYWLGRDMTLTGRTYLWQAVWEMIQRQPWLGYGYNAFWSGPENSYIWQRLHWRPDNAHNGYLDLWLQLGLPGLVLFTVSVIVNLLKAITLAHRENGWVPMFPLLFLTFMMLHNITESTILFRNQIFWILYVTNSLQLRAGHEKDALASVLPAKGRNNENS